MAKAPFLRMLLLSFLSPPLRRKSSMESSPSVELTLPSTPAPLHTRKLLQLGDQSRLIVIVLFQSYHPLRICVGLLGYQRVHHLRHHDHFVCDVWYR
ncbi:hypothetical protein EV702DRAFT_5677 [Suillus placidus]|uniref:Secreted protein n=1 Tax=Suillus placidus TaxID=48579 RepID=A0A9P7D944_9AGAM|nr:hypothetical protein EV702DRAFT_5677 [Suillus placidus]